MPWKQEEPKWVPDEYPKMLVRDGQPVVYPDGHEKQGLVVVFDNKADEKAYKK